MEPQQQALDPPNKAFVKRMRGISGLAGGLVVFVHDCSLTTRVMARTVRLTCSYVIFLLPFTVVWSQGAATAAAAAAAAAVADALRFPTYSLVCLTSGIGT